MCFPDVTLTRNPIFVLQFSDLLLCGNLSNFTVVQFEESLRVLSKVFFFLFLLPFLTDERDEQNFHKREGGTGACLKW